MSTTFSKYRNKLPQLGSKMFITDGGLETTLVFLRNIDLPMFAAFPLVNNNDGIQQLKAYFAPYIDIALSNKTGIILDTPTWRASHGWGKQLGYSKLDIQYFNETSVRLIAEMRDTLASEDTPIVVNGVIGPQDDGYNPTQIMSAKQAKTYHRHQIETFANSEADMVTAVTMTYANEAIGIARAAKQAGIPAVVSFTVETDGLLPSGMSLQEAIEITDAETGSSPAYYMINCAHPSHFDHVLNGNDGWMKRIYGVRANASCKSHAELDEATELDDGNPQEFGQEYVALRSKLSNLKVVGGCCGTDHRHIEHVCNALLERTPAAFEAAEVA